MKKLADPNYCKNLIILTSKIIDEYLDNTNVTYLAQKKGILGEKLTTEKILVSNADELEKFDVKNPTKKKRLCKC